MPEPSVTVLYYSANAEDPRFEAKIMARLLANMGDLPLVSVTQQPMPNLGRNICVGPQPNCYGNCYRQIEVGLRAVTTPFVLTAEADFLYPPDYFRFPPPMRGRCYRYKGVWVPHHKWQQYRYKGFSNGAQLIDREFWLDAIECALAGYPPWFGSQDPCPPEPKYNVDDHTDYWTGAPVVTFKTERAIHRVTRTAKYIAPESELPYWGAALALRQEFLGR